MSFMHMDATTAASAVGQIIGFPWDDSPPFSGITVSAGGDGFSGTAILELFGEGQANIGKYIGEEDNFEVLNEEFMNPAFTGNITQYFFRTIDVLASSDGNIPGSQRFSPDWSNGRTDWRSFASVSPHTNMVSDVIAVWRCDAAGEFGSAYFEEQIIGTLEIGSVNGLVETFEAANVDLGNDEIVLVGHGFQTGDQVIYTANGAAPTPLVDQGMYSVYKVSNDRISLGNSMADVDSTLNLINITFSGTGTGHTFQRIDADASVSLFMDASV